MGVTGELRGLVRATRGVRLIRLDEGDVLNKVARLAPEDKDDETPLLDGAAGASDNWPPSAIILIRH